MTALTGSAPVAPRFTRNPGWRRGRAASWTTEAASGLAAVARATFTVAATTRRVLAARAALRRALAGVAAPGRMLAPTDAARTSYRVRSSALSRLAAEICAVHGYRVQVIGGVPQGPVVLFANHVSFVDPLVLTSLIPCVPLARREVARWPGVGALGREHGVVFVRRNDAQSGAAALLVARRALRAGVSVLDFPEGTTARGEGVRPFLRGMFGLARRLRIAVVPVTLELDEADRGWTGGALPLRRYLRSAGRPGGIVRVHFGCPMTPERYESADSLAVEARAIIAHMLGVSA